MVARLTLVAALAAGGLIVSNTQGAEQMTVKKLSPIVFVEAIEPCLAFWTERLGFERTAEVPDGDRLGFVILTKDGVEVMYQIIASVEKDLPAPSSSRSATSRRWPNGDGVEVVRPMRTTFYGSKEIFVRAPCGTVVGFAEMTGEQ